MTALKFYKIEMRIIYTYLWDRNLKLNHAIKVSRNFSAICFEISEMHTNVVTTQGKKIVVG
jgi:hypothetical protein